MRRLPRSSFRTIALGLSILVSLAARGAAQMVRADFEPPVWPSAAPAYLYTVPANWNQSVAQNGVTMTFEMRNFGLWGNEPNPVNAAYFGAQAARCRFPQASIGVTGDSILAARSVTDPRGVAFMLASTGLSTVISDARHWVLELWTVAISGSAAGQTLWHKSWTSLRGDLDLSRMYVREAVDLSHLPTGTYDIEWRVTQHANSGSAFEILMDDVEIYLGNTHVPPTPMPLDLLIPLVDAEMPSADLQTNHRQRRSWMVRDLDRHAASYHSQYFNVGDRQTVTPFTEYFRARTRKVIQEISTLVPAADEVLVWKLYSSGFVVKTPRYTFGFDVQQGPNPQGFFSAHSLNIAAALTEQDTDDLIAELDFVFHTHGHHDHTNYDFLARMIAAGKTVFGPAQQDPNDPLDLREFYDYWGTGLYTQATAKIVDPYNTNPRVNRLAEFDIDVCVFKGVQSSSVMLAPVGPIPPPSPLDNINYSYHVTTDNGITLLVMGDSRQVLTGSQAVSALDPVLGWFDELKNLGLRVDMKLGAGPLIDSNVWRTSLIERFRPFIRIHGHEWEMNHTSLGMLTRSFGEASEADESAFPLSLGESFRFRNFPVIPAVDPSSLTSTSAIIRFETTQMIPSTVYYGTAAEFARGIYPKSKSAAGAQRIHNVQLTGLLPGETYYFYVATTGLGPIHGYRDATLNFETLNLVASSTRP